MNALPGIRNAVWIGVIILVAAAAAFFFLNGGIDLQWRAVIDGETPAATVIVLFLILPLVGFPISVFLLWIGARFDAWPALMIMFIGMGVHQAITYPAGNTFLRPLIEKLLSRKSLSLPQFSEEGYVWPSIFFMAVPGLSYTMKNYILALSGVPFRHFFMIAWLVQAVMGIPVILAGGAVSGRHYRLLLIVFLLMAVMYGLRYWLARRRRRRSN